MINNLAYDHNFDIDLYISKWSLWLVESSKNKIEDFLSKWKMGKKFKSNLVLPFSQIWVLQDLLFLDWYNTYLLNNDDLIDNC